jgi:hypothetical protein
MENRTNGLKRTLEMNYCDSEGFLVGVESEQIFECFVGGDLVQRKSSSSQFVEESCQEARNKVNLTRIPLIVHFVRL